MKKTLMGMLTLCMLLLASCSNRNTEALLLTVPKSTPMLAIADVEKMGSRLGQDAPLPSDLNASWSMLLDGDTEADLSTPVVVFQNKNATIATVELKNADKFRSQVEEKSKKKFVHSDGIWCLDGGTVFVCGNQAWLTAEYPRVESSDILGFTKLKEPESVLALDYSSEMAVSGHDVSYLFKLGGAMQSASQSVYLNMLFDNPQYVGGYVDFKEGKAEGSAMVMNGDFLAAPLALELEQIDSAALKEFRGKGNLFAAVALDKSLVEKVMGQLKGLMRLPSRFVEILESLDGNAVMACTLSGSSLFPRPSALMLTFESEEAAQKAAEFIADIPTKPSDLSVRASGRCAYFQFPQAEGVEIAGLQGDFNDALLAVAMTTEGLDLSSNPKLQENFKGFNLKCVRSGEGIQVKYELLTPKGRNSLESCLIMMHGSEK